jgi:hypothetical protein
MSKNEIKERASNTGDNDSVIDEPGRFATYDVIGCNVIFDTDETDR